MFLLLLNRLLHNSQLRSARKTRRNVWLKTKNYLIGNYSRARRDFATKIKRVSLMETNIETFCFCLNFARRSQHWMCCLLQPWIVYCVTPISLSLSHFVIQFYTFLLSCFMGNDSETSFVTLDNESDAN